MRTGSTKGAAIQSNALPKVLTDGEDGVNSNTVSEAVARAASDVLKAKKAKVRCDLPGCRAKVPVALQAIVCRCDKVFCAKHRDVSSHNCSVPMPRREFQPKRFYEKGSSGGSNCAY